MNLPKIAGIALAVMLVAGGTAAALPGNAPADALAPNQTDTNETVTHAVDANETDRRPHEGAERGPPARGPQMSEHPADRGPHANENDSAVERGPPTEMPEQVPDFVTELHETINQFRTGELEGDLGSAIADVVPDDAADEPKNSDEQVNGEQSADEDREHDEQAESEDHDESDNGTAKEELDDEDDTADESDTTDEDGTTAEK